MDEEAQPLRALRRARRGRRRDRLRLLKVVEQVYTWSFATVMAIGVVGSVIPSAQSSPETLATIGRWGPHAVGAVVVAAMLTGHRSGRVGGPLVLPPAVVVHELMSPIPTREVLRAEIGVALWRAALGGGIVGAVSGIVLAAYLPGSDLAVLAGCALVGLASAVLGTIQGVLAHGRPVASAAVVGAAAVSLVASGAGDGASWPLAQVGSAALSPVSSVGPAVVPVVLLVLGAAAAVAVTNGGDRHRLDLSIRRAELVTQLRFAAATADIRAVLTLRQHLVGERRRTRPWLPDDAMPGSRSAAVGWRVRRGLLRMPLPRVARMAIMAASASVALVLTVEGVPVAVVGAIVACGAVALDLVEAWPTDLDRFATMRPPVALAWLYEGHTRALLVPGVVIGVLVALPAMVDDSGVAGVRSALPLGVVLGAAMVMAGVRATSASGADLMMDAISAGTPEAYGMKVMGQWASPVFLLTLVLGPLAFVDVEIGGVALSPSDVAIRTSVVGAIAVASSWTWNRYVITRRHAVV